MIKTSLFADQEREAKLNKLGDALQVMEQHVDFAALAAEVDLAAPRPSRERGGRPPFPTELMVRVLLIQQLFNLSDEQMEFQLLDRLSFQRFVGLRASSQIPDRTTIWTFKERLIQAGASESVFDAVIRLLSRHGYIARGGQMIDASIVEAPRQSLSKEEKAIVSEGAMPADWKPAKRRQKDRDARWTKKHGKSYFGYKVFATPTSLQAGAQDQGEHGKQTRHHAFRGRARSRQHEPGHPGRQRLCRWRARSAAEQTGLAHAHPAQRQQGQADLQGPAAANHRIAKTPASIEHVFAGLAQMGGKTLRSIALARARLHLNWKVAAYNLQRLVYLKEAGVEAF
jgi:IS5 family transposase